MNFSRTTWVEADGRDLSVQNQINVLGGTKTDEKPEIAVWAVEWGLRETR